MVSFNDLSAFPAPFETVAPAAPDAGAFAIDDCPDSPLIMSGYADAGSGAQAENRAETRAETRAKTRAKMG